MGLPTTYRVSLPRHLELFWHLGLQGSASWFWGVGFRVQPRAIEGLGGVSRAMSSRQGRGGGGAKSSSDRSYLIHNPTYQVPNDAQGRVRSASCATRREEVRTAMLWLLPFNQSETLSSPSISCKGFKMLGNGYVKQAS